MNHLVVVDPLLRVDTLSLGFTYLRPLFYKGLFFGTKRQRG